MKRTHTINAGTVIDLDNNKGARSNEGPINGIRLLTKMYGAPKKHDIKNQHLSGAPIVSQ